MLGDHDAFLVQQRGEQLDLPVRDSAQPFPVDGDRGQQPLELPGGGQGAQPAAGDLIQPDRIQCLEQGPDPLLARDGNLPAQRVRPAAEAGQHFLRQVSSLVADLPVTLRPGQHA